MLFFARSIALLAVLAMAGAGPAAAQESGGFFSRFIPSFGSSTPATPAAKPASTPSSSATPSSVAMANPVSKPGAVEAPSGPTEASPFAGGGGGLIATMNGRRSNACDGVVCMFMGGETKGTPEGPAPLPQTTASATSYASPADDRVSPRKERCTAPANDPWRCYR